MKNFEVKDTAQKREALVRGETVKIGRDFGEVQVSSARGNQERLAKAVKKEVDLRGFFTDTPSNRVTQSVANDKNGKPIPFGPPILPPLLSLATAKDIYFNLVQSEVNEGYAPVSASATLDHVDSANPPAFTKEDHAEASMQPQLVENCNAKMENALKSNFRSVAYKGESVYLTAQASFDFLYYAQKVAIHLDSLDGIPSDNELVLWAVVQTVKDTAITIAKGAAKVASGLGKFTMKGGLIVAAVVVGGYAIVRKATK